MKKRGLFCVFAACAEVPPDEEGDPLLIGRWRNYQTGNGTAPNDKDFTVNENFLFECSIDPGNQGRATITGTLARDSGDIYIIGDLEGKTEADKNVPWVSMAGNGYNGQAVKITFSNNDTFYFQSANGNEDVTTFFGGTYYRVNN